MKNVFYQMRREKIEEEDRIVKQTNNDEILDPFALQPSTLPNHSYIMNITEMKFSLLINKGRLRRRRRPSLKKGVYRTASSNILNNKGDTNSPFFNNNHRHHIT